MSPKTFQEAKSIYDRATRLEFASEFSSAFPLYLEASDAFLSLSRSNATNPNIQVQCRANAKKAIQRAEKIQKASKAPGAQMGAIAVPVDTFDPNHQAYVLRNSSMVNDIRCPLWSEPVPLPSNPRSRYSDPNGQPTIPSSKTSSIVITWKTLPLESVTSQEPSFALTPADIGQSIINDCSVCASVAVCIQHDQRFNSGLLCSSLFPGNQPGRYDLKANLNGDFRRISVDDLLPFGDSGRPIGISLGQRAIAWPGLIEKAYMKLMGGYDFPEILPSIYGGFIFAHAPTKSNVTIRALVGWIPEHLELQSASFEREKSWERLVHGFRTGWCVLTVGTDAKTVLKIEGVKLLPSHNYAVVDVRETDSERWLTIVDSTVPGTSSRAECDSRPCSSRMLDMRWDDICATFEGIYSSWDPGLFQHGPIHHDVWKPANAGDKAQASVCHLRLLYDCQNSTNEGDDPLDTSKNIWVLLTRHLSQTRRGTEYISLTVRPEDEEDWRDMWVKIGEAEVKGPYTTSPHVLVRTKVREGLSTSSHTSPLASRAQTKTSGALSILACYDGPFDDVFFTVNVYHGASVKAWWDKDAGTGGAIGVNGGGFCVKVDGTLTTKNAGGNHTYPTYMLNPQWHLRIYDEKAGSSEADAFAFTGNLSPLTVISANSKVAGVNARGRSGQKAVVVLSAQGPRDVPMNVTAVWSSGERIVELAQKEVVTSSGAYTYGRARAVAEMAPGDYTVIFSAFEPQIHLGQFTLKIEGSRQFDLEPIPQEGAGMYARVSKGEWSGQTAAGRPSYGSYHANPIYEVQLPSSAQVSARVHLTSPAPTAALNLSLFPTPPWTSDRPLDRPLASSGPYSDALSGVCIPTRMLSAGRYWLVPSTFAAGVHASFRLVVYCSDAGCVVSEWRS